MLFRTQTPTPPPQKPKLEKPKLGDTRTLSVFAWFPQRVKLEDGSPAWCWLEEVRIDQTFVEDWDFDEGGTYAENVWETLRTYPARSANG